MAGQRQGSQRADGWWYPYIFVGGMLVIIAVNVVLILFATGTFTGLETEHHYDRGLAYNDNLRAAEAQEALGWTVSVDYVKTDPPAGADPHGITLEAHFKDRDGQPIDDLDVRAMLVRPTSAGHDRQADMAPQGAGRYTAHVGLPLMGLWNIRVLADRADAHYQLNRRVQVR